MYFLVLFTIFHFDLENFISKNCKYIFFYQKFVHLGRNNFVILYSDNCSSCSCNYFFLKFIQRVTILQTVANQEVTLKRLISLLRIVQKLYVGRKVIYVRCINGSYNNVAKDICLLDKKHFCLYRKNPCK